jgi:hypothetical protein
MNRREAILSTLGAAAGAALKPRLSYGRMGRGGIALPTFNPMGINYSAGGTASLYYEALPLFINRVRESRGFTNTSWVPLALSAAGWPTTDFRCMLGGFTQKLPSWAVGTFKCGFIGSGSESVSVTGGTLANLVHGSGGAYTTFDLTVSAPNNIFFDVTGTTGGATDVFAYIPGYYPGSAQIDNVMSASSLLASTIVHYKQFNHIRNMWLSNTVSFMQQATGSARRTPSNFQAGSTGSGVTIGGYPTTLTFASIPASGATSATLASAWTGPTGQYGMEFEDASTNGDARIVTLTNGATTCTWSGSRALTQAMIGTTAYVGYEGYPVEWMISLCNACGASPWICLPMYEDGTEGAAGSWSTSMLEMIASSYTGSKPVICELGNENWNPGYDTFFVLGELSTLYGFADRYHYYAYRHNQFATLARSVLPAGWYGNKVILAHMDQAVSPSFQTSMLSAYSSNYGAPKNDIAYVGCAPYCNPVTTNSDSIATIQAESTTAAQSAAMQHLNGGGSYCEEIAVVGLHYGIPMATYEGGFQWNNSGYASLANLGAAIMDPGYASCIETLYNTIFNAGVVLGTHFQGGVNESTNATAPVDELSNDYAALPTCPALEGLQSFFPPNALSITRNDITTPGTVIDGRNYTDNTPSISASYPTLGGTGGSNPSLVPYGTAGTVAYLLWSNTARTVALSANFTNSGSSGTSQLEWGSVANGGFSTLGGGTPTQVTIPAGTNAVSIGSFPVTKGWSYILLGKPGTAQASISINSVTAG